MAVLASVPVVGTRPVTGAPLGIKTVHGGQTVGAMLRHYDAAKMAKVPSLVFDLELDESTRFVRASGDDISGFADVTEDITAYVQPQTSTHHQLCIDVEAAMHAGATNAADLAHALSELGYQALLRTALGGGHGNECLTNLRHTFLLCTPPSAGHISRKASHFIVDPQFHDSFEIAKPTPRYSAVLAAVPPVFVGTQECLASLVTLLCDEMKQAFVASGTLLAPWRQADSMLSKWQPRRSMDEPVAERPFVGSSRLAAVAEEVGSLAPPAASPAVPPTAEPKEVVCEEWRGWVSSVTKESPKAASSQGRTSSLSMRLNSQRSNPFSSGAMVAPKRQLPAVCASLG